MQRNVGRKIKIGGQVIARGGFFAYGVGEVHLNPEYYLETYKYDPDRWLQPDLVPRLGGWSTRLYGDETGKVGDEAGFGDVFDEIRVLARGRERETPRSFACSEQERYPPGMCWVLRIRVLVLVYSFLPLYRLAPWDLSAASASGRLWNRQAAAHDVLGKPWASLVVIISGAHEFSCFSLLALRQLGATMYSTLP